MTQDEESKVGIEDIEVHKAVRTVQTVAGAANHERKGREAVVVYRNLDR